MTHFLTGWLPHKIKPFVGAQVKASLLSTKLRFVISVPIPNTSSKACVTQMGPPVFLD